jgi:hypothetical protein
MWVGKYLLLNYLYCKHAELGGLCNLSIIRQIQKMVNKNKHTRANTKPAWSLFCLRYCHYNPYIFMKYQCLFYTNGQLMDLLSIVLWM